MKDRRKVKTIFTIMPFVETLTRNQSDLTEFFLTNIKRRIEDDTSTKFKYTVKRSDDSFDINAQIIKDLFSADIVLCDLSGEKANPNVMYELGVRLSITNKPIILFREEHEKNKRIFDIDKFYTHLYKVTKYRELEEFIMSKIKRIEEDGFSFESPVFAIIKEAPEIKALIREQENINCLGNLSASINRISACISGAIDDYLERNGIPNTCKTIEESLFRLAAQPQVMSRIDWGGFRNSPSIPPPLQEFFTILPLNDILDERTRRNANSIFVHFYGKYLSNSYFWNNPTYTYIAGYFVQLDYIEKICDTALAVYKTSDPKLRKKFLLVIDELVTNYHKNERIELT